MRKLLVLHSCLLKILRGNLSIRSLADIVSRDHFVHDSEYLETVLVAVPKYVDDVERNILSLKGSSRANVKDWNSKYERLTTMVVPRSST